MTTQTEQIDLWRGITPSSLKETDTTTRTELKYLGGKDGVNEALRKTKENYQSRLLIPKLIEMKGEEGVKEVLKWEERRKEYNQYFYYADDRRCYETEKAEYELACNRIAECKACLGE